MAEYQIHIDREDKKWSTFTLIDLSKCAEIIQRTFRTPSTKEDLDNIVWELMRRSFVSPRGEGGVQVTSSALLTFPQAVKKPSNYPKVFYTVGLQAL